MCRQLRDIAIYYGNYTVVFYLVQFLVVFVVSSSSQAVFLPHNQCLNVLHFHHKKMLNSVIFMNEKSQD